MGVRSESSMRIRLGSMRCTLADSTQGICSSWLRRGSSGICKTLWVRSCAGASGVPNDRLILQCHAVSFLAALTHIGDQRQHIFGGGVTRIHKKVGMTVADSHIADGEAFEPQLIYHAARGGPRRVFED